ncbi:MAG: HEAT repeat domain-containing protein [Spirochaetes bacterium]|nr:HEAT repeat domain-containing protein [Spirochaetota bacterium]
MKTPHWCRPALLLALLAPAMAAPAPASNAAPENPVETFRRTFRFGTWAQQVEALALFNNIAKSNRAPYEAALELLFPQLDNNELARKFMDLIEAQNLRRYEGYFAAVVARKDGKGDLASPEDLLVIGEALRHMNALSNAAQFPLLADFATNAARNRGHGALVIEGLRAVEIHRPAEFRSKLPPFINGESWAEGVQAAALRALVAYKSPADLEYLISLVKRDDLKSLVRWTAVAGLAEYAPDPRAYATLQALYTSADFEIRARALWALGQFPGTETRELLLRACKDNAPRIRLFAVRGLAKWREAEVNELLEFKRKNDPEKSVREAAEALLRERGLAK